MKQSEILTAIKRKNPGLSEEQIKVAIKYLFAGLRYYWSNPLEAKSGILINGLMTTYIDPRKINRIIERINLQDFKYPNSRIESLAFYNDLLETISNNEKRQNRRKNVDE